MRTKIPREWYQIPLFIFLIGIVIVGGVLYILAWCGTGYEDGAGELGRDYVAARLIILGLYVLSLIHVFIQAYRMKENAIMLTLMVALVIWPIGYILWLLVWPGSLRTWIERTVFSRKALRGKGYT